MYIAFLFTRKQGVNYDDTMTSFMAYFHVHDLAISSNLSRSFMYISPSSGSMQTCEHKVVDLCPAKRHIWRYKSRMKKSHT